jgi:hypothetical protein
MAVLEFVALVLKVRVEAKDSTLPQTKYAKI